MAENFKMVEVTKVLDALTGDKVTRAQRVKKLKDALKLSNLDAEVALERYASEQRIARLRAEEAERESRVRAKVVELLEAERKDVYDALRSKAEAKLAAEAEERRRRAKQGRAGQTDRSPEPTQQHQPQAGQQPHHG